MSYQALNLVIQIRLLRAFAPNTPSKERRANSKWESLTTYWLNFIPQFFTIQILCLLI